MQLKPSKYFVEQRLVKKIHAKQASGATVRVLELGCGRAENMARVLQACPGVEYVGIEPDPASAAQARHNLSSVGSATVLVGLAYGDVEHEALSRPFDFIASLSVLEHVKDLSRFLRYAAAQTKPGGENIHLYDLGHALYPSGWKERLQVALCNSPLLPLIPESKIARYLATEDVQRLIEQTGCTVEAVTFHNARANVQRLKESSDADVALQLQIMHEEQEAYPAIADHKQREVAFPSVCFWTRKR